MELTEKDIEEIIDTFSKFSVRKTLHKNIFRDVATLHDGYIIRVIANISDPCRMEKKKSNNHVSYYFTTNDVNFTISCKSPPDYEFRRGTKDDLLQYLFYLRLGFPELFRDFRPPNNLTHV